MYGLAECSVGLAFTPPGEPWRIDLLDRETFHAPAARRSTPARAGDPAPLKIVGCGRVHRGPRRCASSTPPASSCPTAHEGALQFRGPSATSGYYRNPEATKGLFDGDAG